MPKHLGHYLPLLGMSALRFLAMYGLMYAMVHSPADVYPNINQLYMAGIMTAPMLLLELAFMQSMYDNIKANIGIGLASLTVFLALFASFGCRRRSATFSSSNR
jgi:hypothetical protein